jgi:hypothetical protein
MTVGCPPRNFAASEAGLHAPLRYSLVFPRAIGPS